jgi:uncharacterized protein
MSENKRTVTRYMDAFSITDHAAILSCLADDVIWEMPGFFYHEGKEAFDKEIENDAFEGRPTINTIRLIEENDIVVAEGTVQSKLKNGPILDLVFCDVFHMENGLIKKLTSYVMNKTDRKLN